MPRLGAPDATPSGPDATPGGHDAVFVCVCVLCVCVVCVCVCGVCVRVFVVCVCVCASRPTHAAPSTSKPSKTRHVEYFLQVPTCSETQSQCSIVIAINVVFPFSPEADTNAALMTEAYRVHPI